MTYLSDKARKRNTLRRSFWYVGVFIIFVFLWRYIHPFLYSSIEPVAVGYGSTKQSLSFLPEFMRTYMTSRQELLSKQQSLEREIEQLENMLAEKDALLRERGGLVEAHGSTSTEEVSKSLSSHAIVLYPLMQDVTRIYSTILFSKGFKDGLTVGNLVYLRGNQVACIIKEVYNNSSLCQLLSASGVVTEGVTSSSSVALTLVGRGGHFLADIARDTPVGVGEKVYLRSNPKMIIGEVTQIANNNQDTSWHVFVSGAYNPVTSSIFYVQP
jgi:cell shape-determining protein MreC